MLQKIIIDVQNETKEVTSYAKSHLIQIASQKNIYFEFNF